MSTTDFFTRLEHELRVAAEHPPAPWRARVPQRRAVLAFAVVAAALALAVVPVIAVLGGGDREDTGGERTLPAGPPPVGTVIQRGDEARTVVATGSAPVAGEWQLEAYTSRRGPCLSLLVLSEGIEHGAGGSGACGEFPSTPGFARLQHSVPDAPGAGAVREVLVFGRVPEEATAVVVTVDGRVRQRARPLEGPADARSNFYLLAISPDLVSGRVNWIDAEGREGSRGIALLPI
jgi:hypothetical protein